MAVLAGALLAAGQIVAAAAVAQEPAASDPADRREFFDIQLGTHALEIPPDDFVEYACGTNGGPPATPLKGWADYARCKPEPGTGLHEVQFRYDDEDEYWARARNLPSLVAATEGTKLYIIPVIISALFDDDGFMVGLRAVTDPRVDVEERMRAVALRNFLVARYNPETWTCEKLPREEGDQPIANRFLKERCTRSDGGIAMSLEAYHYRKVGQYGIDPRTNQPVTGLFRSEVRFEQVLTEPIADREQRLAAVQAQGPLLSVRAPDRERAMNCPGCDLSGIDLKRQDLTGANLAGANLSGANLHGAVLVKADLTGANLSGANLNRANLRQAQLAGANLTEALLYAATLDAANLAGADLTKARLGEAHLVRANLEGATVVAVEGTRARLTDANLRNANLGGTWFPEGVLLRSDFSGATMTQMLLAKAQLSDANLSGAVLVGSDLIGANLRGADLTNADFSGTRMTSVVWTNAKREGADFSNVVGLPR